MTIKEIIQKLHITIADHRGHESHFESWLTLIDGICEAIDALKSLDNQEPVAWMYQCSADSSGPVLMQHKKDWAESGSGLWTETPLYTTPPQRKPLLDEQIVEINKGFATWMFPVETRVTDRELAVARAIEAAHGIKE